jgi:pimeloyl-ACP methyl ester carboxylesterase
MADLAQDYADVIRSQFDGPVDILGVSTGGSIALQLAADHPGLVRRLVLVSSAYRLGPRGRAAQRRAAEWLRAGRSRRASAAEMAMLGATTLTQRMLGVVGWVFGTTGLGAGDPDMLATIDAEDGFDLRDRLGQITAPALVVGGERDAFYGPDLFTETAALIPRGQLMLYRRKGHLGTQLDRRLATDVLAFLAG